MKDKAPIEDEARTDEAGGSGDDSAEFKVKDRRHWTQDADADDDEKPDSDGGALRTPSILDEYRERAEAAESKLQEYIEAYKRSREEQDQVRQRLQRDVARRADERFAGLVGELLESVDNLELALTHMRGAEGSEPLARGVELARDQFLAALEREGVERVSPDGASFDPNEAEAVRVDPVDSADRNGTVTETLRPGFRLGERLIRAAQVAVGRFSS